MPEQRNVSLRKIIPEVKSNRLIIRIIIKSLKLEYAIPKRHLGNT